MNALRLVARAGLTATGVAVLVILGSTLASAGPAPLEREPSRGGGSTAAATGETSVWEVLAIGAAGALLAAVLIGLVMVLVTHVHSAHRAAPTA